MSRTIRRRGGPGAGLILLALCLLSSASTAEPSPLAVTVRGKATRQAAGGWTVATATGLQFRVEDSLPMSMLPPVNSPLEVVIEGTVANDRLDVASIRIVAEKRPPPTSRFNYPLRFRCVHCGRGMAVQQESEATAPCTVCPCGTMCSECVR